jgi:hypothetical protein
MISLACIFDDDEDCAVVDCACACHGVYLLREGFCMTQVRFGKRRLA